jgi:hypothetical protein
MDVTLVSNRQRADVGGAGCLPAQPLDTPTRLLIPWGFRLLKEPQVFAGELVLDSTFGTTYGKDSGCIGYEDKSQESVVHYDTPETTIGTPKPTVGNNFVVSSHNNRLFRVSLAP